MVEVVVDKVCVIVAVTLCVGGDVGGLVVTHREPAGTIVFECQ